ncbi:MAG: hypothetical protein JWQ14_3545 [Adhaeribacter sp.]|jgi:hypothetical protein|nr:hypothetical protein [Adhaeribacter sp.]
MAITRLKRKHRKNIARANNKQRVIKQLLATPVIKNVDVEELKAQFSKNTATPSPAQPVEAAKPAKEATAKPEEGIVNTVRGAIAGAAQTVADKVGDVVEAVKDKVEDVLHKDEKESAE